MKASATLLCIASLLIVVSSASAQCRKNCPPSYRPVHRPVYRPSHPIETPPPADDPILDPEPGDDLGLPPAANGVTYEVQVQHPLRFDWQTVKTYEDESAAEQYVDQIKGRYWVVYTVGSNQQYLEGKSLADARSRTGTLLQTGAKVQAIKPIQIQIVEESFQNVFDEAIGGATPAAEASTVPNELQPLLGLWEAVPRDASGHVQRILLDLHKDGTAEMTVPTVGGGETKIERDFAVVDGIFKLTNDTGEIVLGSVVEAGAEKVVLDRKGAKLTFLRP